MHIAKFKATQTYRVCNHYERQEDDGIRRGNENIHAERTHLNYNLCPHREETGYQRIKDIIARDDVFVYAKGKRNDLVNMCDVVITVPKSLPQRLHRDFFAMAYRFFENRFGVGGGMNVVSSWVHMDETTPHMHFAFVPLAVAAERQQKKGFRYKLCANDAVKRQDLKTLHTDMQRFLESKLLCPVDIVTNGTVKSVDMVTFKRRKLAQAAAELAKKQEKVSTYLEALKNGSEAVSGQIKREPVKSFFGTNKDKCEVDVRSLDRLERNYAKLAKEHDVVALLERINNDLNGTTARKLKEEQAENQRLQKELAATGQLDAELRELRMSFKIALEALEQVNPTLARAVKVATEDGRDSGGGIASVCEMYNAFRAGNGLENRRTRS